MTNITSLPKSETQIIYLEGRNFCENKFLLEQIFARINFRDFGQIRKIREN